MNRWTYVHGYGGTGGLTSRLRGDRWTYVHGYGEGDRWTYVHGYGEAGGLTSTATGDRGTYVHGYGGTGGLTSTATRGPVDLRPRLRENGGIVLVWGLQLGMLGVCETTLFHRAVRRSGDWFARGDLLFDWGDVVGLGGEVGGGGGAGVAAGGGGGDGERVLRELPRCGGEEGRAGSGAGGARRGDANIAKEWERVIRKLRARQMPPVGKKRPAEKAYEEVVARLAATLDRAAAKNPNPGRTDTFRRLNRTEYQNAIRDLLALDIDAAALLPKDEASHGFDNVTVGRSFADAAESLHLRGAENQPAGGGRAAARAGRRHASASAPDLTQEEHVEGLPLGTRGGALIRLHLSAGRRVRDSDPARRATATRRSRACASRTNWRCCSIASG